MKLQKQVSRVFGKKEYEKWVIVLPRNCVEQLGWTNGTNLMAETHGKLLLIKPGNKEGGKEMETRTYEEFKRLVDTGLRGEKDGLTWLELRKKANIGQKRPFNQWVRQLETDIGLIREKRKGQTFWRLP